MAPSSEQCKAEACERPADGGKGYCARHYKKWKRGEMPKARFETCHAESCQKRVHARGLCEEHFARDFPGKKKAGADGPADGAAEAPAEGGATEATASTEPADVPSGG